MSEPDKLGDPRLLGSVLAGRYEVERLLGEGAMGAVYKARHVKVGRTFAIKVLHKTLVTDDKVRQRFEREAELAGRVRHPNVIGVVDVGETPDGAKYMVMDFAHGQDLAGLLIEAPMPAERVINLTRQMLEGLYHAHEQGMIHRDFKPENVIVEKDDHGVEVPRIVDFGIAILREGGQSSNAAGRITTNGLVLGTPHYMAPEQAVADPIDHRIDLFALGIVIYEMLSGRLPFDGTGAEVARANLLLDPPRIADRVPFLEVDPLLEAFARRLMAKKRDHRPPTAKAARELLDLIVRDREAAARELGVPASASSRMPATTQPVSPAATRGPSLAEELEAPPVKDSAIVTAPRARTPSRDTTAYDLPPLTSSRRFWIGGGIVVAIAGVATVLALRGDEPAPAPAPPRVVTASPPAPTPTPQPPAVIRAPTPVPANDPVVVPAPATIDVAPPTAPPPRTPGKKPPRVGRQPPTAATPAPTPPVAAPAISAPAPGAITSASLWALYNEVGRDLKMAREARGPGPIAQLENQYRLIQIQDATTTEAKRTAAAATLGRLRTQLAPLKKP